jgi:hypothetical protein
VKQIHLNELMVGMYGLGLGMLSIERPVCERRGRLKSEDASARVVCAQRQLKRKDVTQLLALSVELEAVIWTSECAIARTSTRNE